MFERFRRSWQLTKQSWRVLLADKELMVLPVLSGLAILVVCLSFVVPAALLGGEALLEEGREPLAVALALLFYMVSYSVAFFFQAAVIAGATERMRGGDPSLGSALAAARAHLGRILLWGCIAGTVGFVIKSIQERSELLGRVIMGLVGAAWSLATFFMLPVLVFEEHDIKGSFRRSWDIFRGTWGETMVGSGGIGLAAFLMFLAVGAVAGAIAAVGLGIVAIVVAILGAIAVGVISSALQGVYVAALYRYATAGETPAGFGERDLGDAFVPRG